MDIRKSRDFKARIPELAFLFGELRRNSAKRPLTLPHLTVIARAGELEIHLKGIGSPSRRSGAKRQDNGE